MDNHTGNGDKDNDKNVEHRPYNQEGRQGFLKNNPGRPKGTKNKYSLAGLKEAMEAEEKLAIDKGGVGVFRQFVKQAYANPQILIALMKKFVADKQHTEVTGLEPINFKVEILDGDKKPKSE